MKKEMIGEGLTVEKAKDKARFLLAAPADADITFEIVAMPQKKMFGLFGGSTAKVKASYDDGKNPPKPEPPKAAEKPASVPAPKSVSSKKEEEPQKQEKTVKSHPIPKKPSKQPDEKISAPAKQPDSPREKAKSAVPSDDVTQAAAAYLRELLNGLQAADASIATKQDEDGLTLDINCQDHGIIIGRRGETLDAIQYLISLQVNKGVTDYIRVTLNVGNYREKRAETLRNLAQKNAAHVLRSGRRVVLEPMNPYERRIIHTAIQDIEGVNSRSIGSNNERKVIIELAQGVTPTGTSNDREDRYSRERDREPRGYNRGDRNNRSNPRPAPTTPPTRKLTKEELPKFGKIQ